MSEPQRASWQQRLKAAGFLREDPLVWGIPEPDGVDFDAFSRLAVMAARMNMPMTDLAGALASRRAPEEEEDQTPKAPDTVLTNTRDIVRIAEAVGVEMIGREPPQEVIDRAIARVHAGEKSAGAAAANSAVSEEGGAVREGAPSPQTAVADTLEHEMPEEVRAHDTADQFATFIQMLSGGT